MTHRTGRPSTILRFGETTKVAVRIRLKRMGSIHNPYYRVVVVDSRKKRDGRVIEEIGTYDPTPNPSLIDIDSDRAVYWLGVGAQPSDQARRLLSLNGDLARAAGKKNVVSRIKVAEDDKAAETAAAVKAAEDRAQKTKADAAAEKAKEAAAKEAVAQAEEADAKVKDADAALAEEVAEDGK
mgnify:CR=1 FL=1